MGELLARRITPTLKDRVFLSGFPPLAFVGFSPARQRFLLSFPLSRWVAPSTIYADLKHIFLAKAAVEVFIRIPGQELSIFPEKLGP